LDIDILTYDDHVGVVDGVILPRPEILTNAFVLRPLAELAPDARHPELGQTYAALWAGYDQAAQALRPVAFLWRGRLLPSG
ncbi:MAG: 2-amino-4-hydroxy-6-hydroxymethyldihydropteridine diphosphokinase, partial [Chromatocurvus sp.]